jgi:crotonobetainyl-CoA:carnitine CoA-transferase CaiB-like acyl-CoA transferase
VRCCHVLGVDGLIEDARFADNAARVHHRDELTAELERVLVTRPSADWLALLEADGVPAAEVRDIAQVFEGRQPSALGAVQELMHPVAGAYRLVGAPIRIDGEALAYPRPAPSLGADTREVLTGVGLSEVDIDALVAAGAAIAP